MSYLPLDIDYVTDEIVLKAEKELGETPTVRKEALDQFRKMIQDEPSLTCLIDDSFLLMFLRSRKFNVKKAMGALKNLYVLKSKNKDIFGDFKLEIAEKLIKDKVFTFLPYRDSDGCSIQILAFDNMDFEEISCPDFMTTLAIIEVLFMDISPISQICGIKVIDNVKALDVKHLKYISPRCLMLLARATVGAFPLRVKSVHITNASSIFGWMWSIITLFLSKKIKDRCHFNNTAELKKSFDPAILPEEYGGTLKYDNDFLIKILRKQVDRIHQINSGSYES